MLFDGQHKSAAQIWAGRKTLDCKVYIDPDIRLLKDTNLIAHDKLRQMAFFTSTLIAKYSDIFEQEWEEYLERPGSKNESDFVAFLRVRGKTTVQAKKMLQMAIEQDVDNPEQSPLFKAPEEDKKPEGRARSTEAAPADEEAADEEPAREEA